jgi:AMP deaminase
MQASESSSPQSGPSKVDECDSDEGEGCPCDDEHRSQGPEDPWDDTENERENHDSILPEAPLLIDQEIPDEKTQMLDAQDGLLPRDIQRKTAYYDHVAEKQMSQVDAKLFYQRQLEAQSMEEISRTSQLSAHGSPTIKPKSSASNWEQSTMRRSDSVRSVRSGQSSSQKLVSNRN